jgi:nucleoside-diphosphate-sugar epimerase
MICAITGGTGFIGRSLVSRALAAGAEVRVLTRLSPPDSGLPSSVRMFSGDLTRMHEGAAPLEAFLDGAEVVVHCAGELRDARSMRALHVHGTRRLLAAAAGRTSRWLQLSSVGAYGPRGGIVDERALAAPVGAYETTKTEADRLVLEAAQDGKFQAVVLRPSIVFGPGMPNQSLYQLLSLVERGWFVYAGAPGAMANYVFVDDVADALWLCATSPAARDVYNLSDDRTMEAFVTAIASALGRPAPRVRLPEGLLRGAARILRGVPGMPLTESRIVALTRHTAYPSARIREELGFRFIVGVEEGLRRLVADWRSRR